MTKDGHWEAVYRQKSDEQVSWHQAHASVSLQLINELPRQPDWRIIDVGAGTSNLADDLLASGAKDVTVLDLSESALDRVRQRLTDYHEEVHWLVGDILALPLPEQTYNLWHDRAVFHFLTDAADQDRYVQALTRATVPGAYAIIATFAEDGPDRCSGLPVSRYSAEALSSRIGVGFSLLKSQRHLHTTPFGTQQAFTYCVFQKR